MPAFAGMTAIFDSIALNARLARAGPKGKNTAFDATLDAV
jgi:hypothetical protein